MVHFGLKRSILVHLGPPSVLWSFLSENPLSATNECGALSQESEDNYWLIIAGMVWRALGSLLPMMDLAALKKHYDDAKNSEWLSRSVFTTPAATS